MNEVNVEAYLIKQNKVVKYIQLDFRNTVKRKQ